MKKSELRQIIKEEIENIQESGYARVANILRGLVPKIKTFGIITAENPKREEATSKYNKDANKKLEEKLKNSNFGYTQIKGKYGSFENPFFVPNIKKKELLELGNEFSQESVIYGEKATSGKNDGMVFQMIDTLDNYGKIISERYVFINRKGKSDEYSEVKGRKFQIPFFDEGMHKDALFKAGYVDKNALKESVIKEVNHEVDIIFDNKTTSKKSLWLHRGIIQNTMLDEIRKIK